MEIKKAIIPAAGLGIRFLPITKTYPKEMLPIIDKPAIQYIVEEACNSGIEDIYIIIGQNKQSIKNYFSKSHELENLLSKNGKMELLELIRNVSGLSSDIHFVYQNEPKGLGDAILCAKASVGHQPFAVLLGDNIIDSEVPCLSQLIDIYNKYHSTIIGVQQVNKNDVANYGIVECQTVEDNVSIIKNLIEKPDVDTAPSNIAILGRYIITPEIFEYLQQTKPGKGNEIQLTDALQQMMQKESMYAYEIKGKHYDIGSKLGYLQANIEFSLKRDDLKEDVVKYFETLNN